MFLDVQFLGAALWAIGLWKLHSLTFLPFVVAVSGFRLWLPLLVTALQRFPAYPRVHLQGKRRQMRAKRGRRDLIAGLVTRGERGGVLALAGGVNVEGKNRKFQDGTFDGKHIGKQRCSEGEAVTGVCGS
jgi:hypothetical protein